MTMYSPTEAGRAQSRACRAHSCRRTSGGTTPARTLACAGTPETLYYCSFLSGGSCCGRTHGNCLRCCSKTRHEPLGCLCRFTLWPRRYQNILYSKRRLMPKRTCPNQLFKPISNWSGHNLPCLRRAIFFLKKRAYHRVFSLRTTRWRGNTLNPRKGTPFPT